MSRDRSDWSRCASSGMAGFLGYRHAWAVAASDLACHNLENALGPCPVCAYFPWIPDRDQDDVQDLIEAVLDHPNIWSDGSMEPIPHLDVDAAGAGVFTHVPAEIFDNNRWGHGQDLDGQFDGCSHIFAGVTGPMQTVHRAGVLGSHSCPSGFLRYKYRDR